MARGAVGNQVSATVEQTGGNTTGRATGVAGNMFIVLAGGSAWDVILKIGCQIGKHRMGRCSGSSGICSSHGPSSEAHVCSTAPSSCAAPAALPGATRGCPVACAVLVARATLPNEAHGCSAAPSSPAALAALLCEACGSSAVPASRTAPAAFPPQGSQ